MRCATAIIIKIFILKYLESIYENRCLEKMSVETAIALFQYFNLVLN